MSRLEPSEAKKIVKGNQEKIWHFPSNKYPSIAHYLSGSVRDTLLSILKFIKKVDVIIYKHKYVFFLDNKRLTYGVRKKSGGTGTSSRHINLLCAIGLINKQYQNADEMLDINKEFLANNPDKKRPINAFYFRRYTDEELERCEERASMLLAAGVTSGNISFDNLSVNGLDDMAIEVYPMNDRTAPERKIMEFGYLMEVMQSLIDEQGYVTRQQVKDNLLIQDREIDELFKIYKKQLSEYYYYERPTNNQIAKWDLPNKKYIYTLREN